MYDSRYSLIFSHTMELQYVSLNVCVHYNYVNVLIFLEETTSVRCIAQVSMGCSNLFQAVLKHTAL